MLQDVEDKVSSKAMTKQLNEADSGSHPDTRLSQVTRDHPAKKCGARHKGGHAKIHTC